MQAIQPVLHPLISLLQLALGTMSLYWVFNNALLACIIAIFLVYLLGLIKSSIDIKARTKANA